LPGWSEFLSTLLVGAGLAMDCFAVAVGSGMAGKPVARRHMLRAAAFFGLFQSGMLALGWAAALSIERFISTFDHWVAFGLLAFVGARAIWGARSADSDDGAIDVSRGGSLLLLSVATSIDALAVGLGLALARSNVVVTSLVVGVVTFIIASVGFYAGRKTGAVLGRPAKLVGGLILIGIGARILIDHMLG
jgi:putative Mn2+ efflux pump MntP